MTVEPQSLVDLVTAVVIRDRTPAQQAWLRRCGGVAPHAALPDLDGTASLDALLDRAWQERSRAERIALGQVFTPRAVARQTLHELPAGPSADARVLDPACGGGIFLAEAARWLEPALPEARGLDRARALRQRILGIDVDPRAAALGRLILGDRIVDALGDADPGDLELPQVIVADALDPATHATIAAFAPTHVLGNPPYLEAKRMPGPDRDRLRARMPELTGAFDLYMAFCHLALAWVGERGVVALVLPNKVQVARYARDLRAVLAAGQRLHALIDLAELPVFARIGVYPIVVVIGPVRRTVDATYKAAHRHARLDTLGQAPLRGVDIPHGLLGQVMDPPVWFTLPDRDVAALASRLVQRLPRLGDVAAVRSTCSFHRKGLRERFVRPGDELPEGLPYLGGQSWSRRNEIRPYRVDWTGHRIDFDAETFRALRNPLPPLECFQRPKVVFCQHARSLIAYGDVEGRFVTKDVFPIVLPGEPSAEAAWGLTAILNSRVFSLLYAMWFRGIQISGGYLHFLPVYLRRVPVPPVEAWRELAPPVARLQAGEASEDAARALDDAVTEAYGLPPREAERVREITDDELGFAPQVLARR